MAMDGPWRMCSAPARRARRPSNSKLGLGDLVYIVSNTDSINTAGGCNVFGKSNKAIKYIYRNRNKALSLFKMN